MTENTSPEQPLCKPLESFHDGQIIVETQSEFQNIKIVEHPNYGHQLVLDNDLQISESDGAYNTAMVAPLLSCEHIEKVAILGGGDGGVLKETLNSLKTRSEFQKATLVDIDCEVIRLCKEYLPVLNEGAFDDPQSEIIIGDALGYIENTRGLDAVIYDLTMDPVREHFSREKYIHYILKTIRKSLRPGGVISMQCCGQYAESEAAEQQRQWLLKEIHKAAQENFVGIVEQQVYVPSFHETWTFLGAVKPET